MRRNKFQFWEKLSNVFAFYLVAISMSTAKLPDGFQVIGFALQQKQLTASMIYLIK